MTSIYCVYCGTENVLENKKCKKCKKKLNPKNRPFRDYMVDKLKDKVGIILSIIRTLGIIISVVTLAAIALKIMFGSIEEKAKYKETLVPWIVGAFMVFSMTTIPDMIYDITSDSTRSSRTYPGRNRI